MKLITLGSERVKHTTPYQPPSYAPGRTGDRFPAARAIGASRYEWFTLSKTLSAAHWEWNLLARPSGSGELSKSPDLLHTRLSLGWTALVKAATLEKTIIAIKYDHDNARFSIPEANLLDYLTLANSSKLSVL